MKAILEFELNDAMDKMAHKQCIKAEEMAVVLWTFYYNMKNVIHDELDENNIDGHEAVDVVFAKFRDLLDEYSIDVDELCQ